MKTIISEYDKQAAAFLHTNRIAIAIVQSGTKHAPWATPGQPCGRHYSVTLQKTGKRLNFDFWGSISDREKGEHPTAYDVLACISGDVHCPDTFADFCAEYGYDRTLENANMFRRCKAFARKLHAFFTEAELNGLSEIQ